MEQSYSETPGTSHIENTQSQNDAPGPSNVSIERSNVMRVHDILGTDSHDEDEYPDITIEDDEDYPEYFLLH